MDVALSWRLLLHTVDWIVFFRMPVHGLFALSHVVQLCACYLLGGGSSWVHVGDA